jgi:trigger factor
MKTSSKSLENCQVKLDVTLDAEETVKVIKDVEKAFMREVQIPGFRKGKVPLEIIRKDFASGLKSEIQNALVQRNYKAAVEAEKIEALAIMDVTDVTYGAEGGSFSVTVDVKPTFKIPTYKGLKIEFKDTKIEDSLVKDQMNRLRAAYATYEDAKEGEVVAEGDFVQINYEGTVSKQKISEVAPDAKVIAEGKGFWTQVEEGRFIPEILEALKGMKAGETKAKIKVAFDKEQAPEGLKGKKGDYTVTLERFRRRILPDDATLIEKSKGESIEKMEATIRESLEKRAVDMEAARRENQAIELLMRKVDFAVPKCQVYGALDGVLEEFKQRAMMSGVDPAQLEQNKDKIREDAEKAAEQRVRLWYVLDAIAEAEKIEAKDEEKGRKVLEFILANAKK